MMKGGGYFVILCSLPKVEAKINNTNNSKNFNHKGNLEVKQKNSKKN